MRNEMDQDGKLDLDHASAAATVGAGLDIQDKSKQAMHRINAMLTQTQEVTENTKLELYR